MMESENLHLLINEELYIIKTDNPQVKGLSPEINEQVPIVFIHNTSDPEELALLNKIIDACKLNPADFRIYTEGENSNADKSIIFTEKAETYYVPQVNQKAKVLYSQPLSILLHSREQKGKLWEALKSFL